MNKLRYAARKQIYKQLGKSERVRKNMKEGLPRETLRGNEERGKDEVRDA